LLQGTSGCGKSTFGSALAQALSIPFIDGDDLHPTFNVEKMSKGESLTDQDRLPWLQKIREKAIQITHPIDSQSASEREKSSLDEPLQEEEKVREMAEVLETSKQRGDEGETTTSLAGDENTQKGRHGGGDTTIARACVIACSALKRSYRDLLRGKDSSDLHVIHIYLKVEEEELKRRMHDRKGHFMKESMLQSQLATLEDPRGEPDTIIIQDEAPDLQVEKAKEKLKMLTKSTL
jgi:gluconokinase